MAMALRPKLRIPALLLFLFLVLASFTCNFLWPYNTPYTRITAVEEGRDHIAIPSRSSWRQQLPYYNDDEDALLAGSQYDRVWNPVQSLRLLLPYALPRQFFPPPILPSNGFLFATIEGEFHEIHASICDFVVIARLLNATLVLPKIHDMEAAKGNKSKVKSFSYLYDEQHFISALAGDVQVVKLLPQKFQSSISIGRLSVKSPSRFASIEFYLEKVLPKLKTQGACGLIFSDGGGLQSLLPEELVEYQRLRCRVAFHALRFRQAIQNLGLQLVRRLEEQGQPYVVVHFGLGRHVLAHYGCADLFQDLQAEMIQSQRALMLKTGKITGKLYVDSYKQRQKGLCPLMPGEVGILLEGMGYRRGTRVYLAGTEIVGGQRLILPLRSMFDNLDDRFTLSTMEERAQMYGFEELPVGTSFLMEGVFAKTLMNWFRASKKIVRSKLPPLENWWSSVGKCDFDMERLRTLNLMDQQMEEEHLLLWAALDYIVSLEANTFFPAFDRDGHGHPNMASLIMGHRLYASPSLKTFRPNRSKIVHFLDKNSYNKGREWKSSVQDILMNTLEPESLAHASILLKVELFLAHPLPECGCQTGLPASTANATQLLGPDGRLTWGGEGVCPDWMIDDSAPHLHGHHLSAKTKRTNSR